MEKADAIQNKIYICTCVNMKYNPFKFLTCENISFQISVFLVFHDLVYNKRRLPLNVFTASIGSKNYILLFTINLPIQGNLEMHI